MRVIDVRVTSIKSQTEQFGSMPFCVELDITSSDGYFFTPNLVHGLIGYGHHMEAVVADLFIGQGLGDALGKGGTHVLTDVFNLLWFASVRLKVRDKVDHRLMNTIPTLGFDQARLAIYP